MEQIFIPGSKTIMYSCLIGFLIALSGVLISWSGRAICKKHLLEKELKVCKEINSTKNQQAIKGEVICE